MDKINVQLYSLGMDNTDPLEVSLEKLAGMGYTGVEFFASRYGGLAAGALRAALEKNGMGAPSAHVNMENMLTDMPFLAELGVKNIICPMYEFATAEEAKAFGEKLNEVGRTARQHGLRVGYHNHTQEFYVDAGKTLLEHLMENTDPELVGLELDCGWCSCAGADPVQTIQKYAGRILAIHVKENDGVLGPDTPVSTHAEKKPAFEMGADGKPIFTPEFLAEMEVKQKLNVPTGQGIVNWKAVKQAADAQGAVFYVVEREASYGGKARLDCLAEDAAWLKANL